MGDALTIASADWAATEFAQIDLGDARLNRRARTLMERFAADPMASIPEACDGWGETIAAYRFLGNESVDRGGHTKDALKTSVDDQST